MTNVLTSFTNIRKGAFKNLRTALLNVHVDIGTNVYSSYPLKNVSLPLITIENGSIAGSEETEVLTGLSAKNVTLVVMIHSKQAETLDTYADAVEAAIRAYESTFKTYGLILKKNGVEDTDKAVFLDLDNNRVHAKNLSVFFEVDA